MTDSTSSAPQMNTVGPSTAIAPSATMEPCAAPPARSSSRVATTIVAAKAATRPTMASTDWTR